jgi:hypothetical protein
MEDSIKKIADALVAQTSLLVEIKNALSTTSSNTPTNSNPTSNPTVSHKRKREEEDFTIAKILQDQFNEEMNEDEIDEIPENVSDNCPICQELLNVLPSNAKIGDKVWYSNCQPMAHGYHLKCICSWLEEKKSCPLCMDGNRDFRGPRKRKLLMRNIKKPIGKYTDLMSR